MFRRILTFWFFPIILLCSGCGPNGIPLFNSSGFWGSRPDFVVINKGDTLYSISRAFDVPMREIIEANNLKPPYTLSIGQKLRLPHAKYHIVEKGDTIYNIAKRNDVDMNTLSKLNNIDDSYTLRIGQRLVLPDSIVEHDTPTVSPQKTATKSTSKSWKSSKKTTVSKKKSTTRKTAKSSTRSYTVKKRTTKFAWPVRGTVVSKFGVIAKGRNNDGINIKAPLGTTVKAADAGTVAYAGNELKGFGNLILIRHNDGWITAYAHNDRLNVKKGQKVKKGEKIATVGSTGGVNTPQLHFEIRAGKKAVNPLSYLP